VIRHPGLERLAHQIVLDERQDERGGQFREELPIAGPVDPERVTVPEGPLPLSLERHGHHYG
jgi:hypothetical protein